MLIEMKSHQILLACLLCLLLVPGGSAQSVDESVTDLASGLMILFSGRLT
jgi:hypothetical protein